MQKNDTQASIARFFCIQFFCLKSTDLAAWNSELTNAAGRPGASMPAEHQKCLRQDSAPSAKILIVCNTAATSLRGALAGKWGVYAPLAIPFAKQLARNGMNSVLLCARGPL
jgi:hypothetical protein